MSLNLIDEAKKLLPEGLIRTVSSSLGEKEDDIQKAFNGAIPSVIAGFLNKSSQSNDATTSAGFLDMAKTAANSGILGNLTSLLGNSGGGIADTVMGWLKSLFGNKLSNIISSIASFAGIKTSSASSILSMAAPLALSSIGNAVKEKGLGVSGLNMLLSSQKTSLFNSIPWGFNLSEALGLSSIQDIGKSIGNNISDAKDYVGKTAKKASNNWLVPLLLLLAAAALIWFFTQKGCSSGSTATNDTTVKVITPTINNEVVRIEGKLDTITGDFVYNLGDTIAIDLPNSGGQLKVGKWSTEARLFEFLMNDEAVDTAKGNWFDFTNVRFKTGGAVLTDDSYIQLKNLVAIIKAFPNAQFKIGGYTDSTGVESSNVILSQKRADAVAGEIVKLGISNTQITGAVGYGSKFPVGDNTTPEGRAVNRRVSVNVKAK